LMTGVTSCDTRRDHHTLSSRRFRRVLVGGMRLHRFNQQSQRDQEISEHVEKSTASSTQKFSSLLLRSIFPRLPRKVPDSPQECVSRFSVLNPPLTTLEL